MKKFFLLLLAAANRHISSVSQVSINCSCTRLGRNISYILDVINNQAKLQDLFLVCPLYIPASKHQLDLTGKHSAMLQLLHEHNSFTYPPLSITSYSFIQLIEKSDSRQRGVNEIAKASKRQQVDENPGSLNWESDVLTTTPPSPHPT